jgi:hypothetical protein
MRYSSSRQTRRWSFGNELRDPSCFSHLRACNRRGATRGATSVVSQMNLAGIQENIATVSNQSKDQMQMLDKLKLKIESLIAERSLSCETNRKLHLQNACLRYERMQIMKAFDGCEGFIRKEGEEGEKGEEGDVFY